MDVLFLRNIKKEFMTREDLIISLQKIVKPYVQDQNAFKNLSEETDFINDLKINSANLVDVILDVEDEFDIEIDNDSMEKMLSVKAAVEIIETKLSAS
jgi:acyl carrier protein